MSDEDQPKIDYWLKTAGESHLPGIKTLQYFKRLAGIIEKSEDEYNRYRELQTDPAHLEFHAKHGAPGSSLTEEDAARATRLMSTIYEEMDSILANSDWIVGGTYTLADISWGPNITTQKIGGFDFSPFPNVEAWYERVSSRPQFDTAFLKWIREAAWGHN